MLVHLESKNSHLFPVVSNPLKEPVLSMKELAVFWMVICFFKMLRTGL
jgi:hypothetical protein